MEKEARRQKKDKERAKLYQETKDRLHEELLNHESIQSQLHAVRDSIERKRAYADKAEKEIREIDLLLSAGSLKEDQFAIELARLQVELAAYQSKMAGAEQELQRARDLTEELTVDKNKAKEEAQELREERRKATEQRRLDAARREGIMRGKLEGMYAGWEDGKILGYREGRKDGARTQYDEMYKKEWKMLKQQLPEYDRFEGRIPSPVGTFVGDVPRPLRELLAPIILPPAPKEQPLLGAPPQTVYHDESDGYFQQILHSSPETIQHDLPPVSQPTTRSRARPPANVPTSDRSDQEPRARNRPRPSIPPPRPIFEHGESAWEPPPSRPEVLERTATQRAIGAIGKKVRRRHQDIVPAPEEMDFAPMAPPLPYPSVTTPLPQSRTMMPGRAIITPTPSIYGRGRREYSEEEEEYERDRERQIAQRQEEERPRSRGKGNLLSLIGTKLRGSPSQSPIDPSSHPLAYQEAVATPHILRLDDMTPSPPPSPRPSLGRRSINLSAPLPPPTPVRQVPPSPRHPRPVFLDIIVPSLDDKGKFELPPPHEMEGSAMESAIKSQNPSRNPSRNPSPSGSHRSLQRPSSAIREPDPSPGGKLSRLGGSIKKTASAVIHAIPSRSHIRDESRGGSGSASRGREPDPIQIARERSRSRSPARPGSRVGMSNFFTDVPEDGLLRPEDIRVGPSVSGTTVSEIDNGPMFRERSRRGSLISQNSRRSSPDHYSIQSNGAPGLSRGGDSRDAGFVTYPNANPSTANLSIMAEERKRLSHYDPNPGPQLRQTTQNDAPMAPADFFPSQPPGSQRQYSESSIREYNDGREPWDPNPRYPPPAPSIRSQASSYAPPPPIKSPRSGPYPWPNRPVPAKITMPALLGPQSPASSRGGYAGIGAGGGYHKRAMSASALSPGHGPSLHDFASPHAPAPARSVRTLLLMYLSILIFSTVQSRFICG